MFRIVPKGQKQEEYVKESYSDFDERTFDAVNDDYYDVTCGEENMYRLRTDQELIDKIIEEGFGEAEFHTADIERLLRELDFLREIIRYS